MVISPEEACANCSHVARYHTSDADTLDAYEACRYGSNANQAVFGDREVVMPNGLLSSDYECDCQTFIADTHGHTKTPPAGRSD